MEKSIGGLWLGESGNGKKYMKGEITLHGSKIKIIVFKNDRKQPGEKYPDYHIFESIKQEQAKEEYVPNEEVPF